MMDVIKIEKVVSGMGEDYVEGAGYTFIVKKDIYKVGDILKLKLSEIGYTGTKCWGIHKKVN